MKIECINCSGLGKLSTNPNLRLQGPYHSMICKVCGGTGQKEIVTDDKATRKESKKGSDSGV